MLPSTLRATYPLARIICILTRCPLCGSRLRYRTASAWRCANCATVLYVATRQESEN